MNTPSSTGTQANSGAVSDQTEAPVTDTGGIRMQGGQAWLSNAVEMLSSMRFAISLLCLISISTIIGTVLKQNEPMGNYVNQFGPFWSEVFGKISLYAVYSAWWFLLIMGFLVLSTSLCIIRNAPKMMKDMRSWRENVREQSLRNFHHKLEWRDSADVAQLVPRLSQMIADSGYQVKQVEKDGATLIVAKRGAANKFGYIFAHSAIVIICLGGLLDSDLAIRLQQWMLGKEAFQGGGVIAEIPAKHRLSVSNPTFRANTMISEGASSNTAIIPQQNGVLIQELPFTIELKKFVIDFYSTGMPKLFASDVVIKDPENGKQFSATIKVNEPLIYRGIAIYQSSFEDGGSKLKLTGHAMVGGQAYSFPINGEVGTSTVLTKEASGTSEYTIEWTGFKPMNVENMSGQDTRAVNQNKKFDERFALSLDKHTGSAAKNADNKNLKNIGPNVQYKVRDKNGQAREYQNYLQPVTIDGAQVYLSGMRESPGEPFSYLRIPVDDEGGVNEWLRLRAALQNPQMRATAALRFTMRSQAQTANGEKLREQMQESTLKSLEIFAGVTSDGKGGYIRANSGGFNAVEEFMRRLPESERMKALDIFMKLLNGGLWDLQQLARERQNLPTLPLDEKHWRYLQLAAGALSDSFYYGAPVYLQLEDFVEVKASVLQLTRSPGKNVVYLGCLLLVLGVFAMFYIRERRLWIWLKADQTCASGGSQCLLAVSTQRKTLDFEHEFERLKAQIQQMA